MSVRILSALAVAVHAAAATPSPAAELDPFSTRPVISAEKTYLGGGASRLDRLVQWDPVEYPRLRVETVQAADPGTGAATSHTRAVRADRVLVTLRRGTGIDAVATATGFRPLAELGDGVWSLAVPPGLRSVPDAVAALTTRGLVADASPVFVEAPAGGLPDDPLLPKQWGLMNSGQTPSFSGKAGVPGADIAWWVAWQLITPSNGPPRDAAKVVVAVLDSGLDFKNPAFKGRVWYNENILGTPGFDDDGNGYVDDVRGVNLAGPSNDPTDTWGHGTATAAIVAAVQDDATGIAGVARNVRLMTVRIVGDSKLTDSEKTWRGLRYAVDNGADVIVVGAALGYLGDEPGATASKLVAGAIAEARDKGIVVVVPAGNQGMEVAPFPPGLDNVLRVAASDNRDELADVPGAFKSNWGMGSVDIAAPGFSVAPWPGLDHHPTFAGTSAAAPHVAGVAALVKSIRPGWSAAMVRGAILAGADQVPGLAGRTRGGTFAFVGGVPKPATGRRLDAAGAVAKAAGLSLGPF